MTSLEDMETKNKGIPPYRCYYCETTLDKVQLVLDHCLRLHPCEMFKLRRKILQESSGCEVYQSIHFNVNLKGIQEKIDSGCTCIIDIDEKKIRFKRKINIDEEHELEPVPSVSVPILNLEATVMESDKEIPTDDTGSDKEFMLCVRKVLEIIEETGRGKDFISLLQAVENGKLDPKNLALHLLLDVGNFLAAENVNQVRYNKTTLDFWCLVKKMFRGKATRLFRGYMAEDSEEAQDVTLTEDCKFNFVVPSDRALSNHSKQYKVDASNPGILHSSLKSLAKVASDCKISIDGKKLAYGFGKSLGDEDLCGYEDPPSLKARKEALAKETGLINDLIRSFTDYTVDSISVHDILPEDIIALRQELLDVIHILSLQVKQLRELSLKKKNAILLLKKKVEGDWKTSKLAPSISYLQTKIIQADSCLHGLLECIDDLGFLVACLNGTGNCYVRGFDTRLYMQYQPNYKCLQQFTPTTYENMNADDASITKQRTEQWHNLRNNAVITGSTWYSALGLRTLKEQKKHFEIFIEKKSHVHPENVQELLQYGVDNEIHGTATLLGKFIPVYYPQHIYKEDGCEVLKLHSKSEDSKYAVVSGDGTGVGKDSNIAFEVKCPIPGKSYCTDVSYRLPTHYTIQVLSQMKVKNCDTYVNVCYSPTSTTFVQGNFDGNLWTNICKITEDIYCQPVLRKPTKCHPSVATLKTDLRNYADRSMLQAEFPSLRGVPCDCSHQLGDDPTEAYNDHCSQGRGGPSTFSVEDAAGICTRANEKHQEAYNILRRPAKEVLVTVASDLDRSHLHKEKPHAAPIGYHLSGFSLRMKAVRGILQEIILECKKNDLDVQVVAFDGQFLEIAIQDDDGQPLTMCRLQKAVWQEARKLTKKQILDFFHDMTHVPRICTQDDLMSIFHLNKTTNGYMIQLKEPKTRLLVQPNIGKYVFKHQVSLQTDTDPDNEDHPEDIILQYLPEDIVDGLDDECLHLIHTASAKISQTSESEQQINTPNTEAPSTSIDYEAALCALLAGKSGSNYESCSVEDLKEKLQNGTRINKSFTVLELKTLLATVTNVAPKSTSKKIDLVLQVSRLFGDSSGPPRKESSPEPLKKIVSKYLSEWPVVALSITYCNNVMTERIDQWNGISWFKPNSSLKFEDLPDILIPQWYAQPAVVQGQPVQHIIDPHHLFVNNRARVCAHGIPAMGIKRDAWRKVAMNARQNGTGLNLELVEELRDRQRNSYAATTFSAEVEKEMQKNQDYREADWCRLIRGWYSAVDEAGITAAKRIQQLLEMRSFLLAQYSPMTFPPPGAYVNSLPMAQFEGFLLNVDRRIQLYTLVKKGTFNHRAISSLDSETFFGSFQDLDPKGTGVLRADDIPVALGNACFILEQRLNSQRGFFMTTAKSRVYKCDPFSVETQSPIPSEEPLNEAHTNSNQIWIKHHAFDEVSRRTTKPKRKSGTISTVQLSSRGASGVREYHKTNEEKILAHRRCGYSDADIDILSAQ